MPAPNQKIIYIQRISDKATRNFFKIGNEYLDKAAKDLSPNAFKLYIYLCNNQNNFRYELYSKDFIEWSNTSDSTYDRVVAELKNKHYLIKAKDKKCIYLFVEESKSYNKRHKQKEITNKEIILKLFGE